MSLIQLKDAYLSFGDDPILDNIALNIQENERICLVGLNGCGKSTLLKVLMGIVKLDQGTITKQNYIKVSYMQQVPEHNLNITVLDYLLNDEDNKQSHIIKQYYKLIAQNNSSLETELTEITQQIDELGAWNFEYKINTIINKLELDPQKTLTQLSGGQIRKVSLARALISEPDVLLLDEPTNHLDIDTIAWLEDFIIKFKGTLVIISHDRKFIDNIATSIYELDRGKIYTYKCNYQTFLVQKAERLRVEEETNKLFDIKLAQEEIWIRQGIKARRTRNEGRVRNLEKLREIRSSRIEHRDKMILDSEISHRTGKVIFDLENISYSIANKELIKNFTTTIRFGDKIALIGANGTGKTTLLKLILGELKPETGKIKHGTHLEIAYFDQYRGEFDPNQTVGEAVADGTMEVLVNGVKKHVIGYLGNFLFSPKKVRSLVSTLSGGELNRLLLAKLFLKPHNLLILDEPTNDLDIETLEMLEEYIINYPGTIIMVSHDREFMENTVTECYFFEEKGTINKYTGGYIDSKKQQSQSKKFQNNKTQSSKIQSEFENKNSLSSIKENNSSETKGNKGKVKLKTETKKLSFKEKQELEMISPKMEAIEEQMQSLNDKIQANTDPKSLTQDLMQLANLEQELDYLFSRWEELENKQN